MGKESIGGTGERFRAIANELFDGNKSELARALDMKPSSFAKYTDGSRRPGSKVLERLSRLGVNINWFLSGEGRMKDESLQRASDSSPLLVATGEHEGGTVGTGSATEQRFVRIPLLRLRDGDAGDGQLMDAAGVTCLSEQYVRQRYGVDPLHLREFRVSGDTMGDTVRPGDRLLVNVDGCDSLVDGSICLIGSRSGVLVRRVRFRGEAIVLVADGPKVPDEDVSRDQWNTEYIPLAHVLEIFRSV